MKTSIEFRIYVGTYAKYNDGSLFGKWMNLSDYENLGEFYKACRKLHKDEQDGSGHRPEFMFQDWEYIPGFLISECSLHPETFNYLEVIAEMDDERRDAFELYCSDIASWPERGKDIYEQLESFNESYQGYFSGSTAKEDFAYQFVEDTGLITDANPTVRRYFDYSAFARDLFLDGYTEIDGHVFIDY
jgi:antirestriction protein